MSPFPLRVPAGRKAVLVFLWHGAVHDHRTLRGDVVVLLLLVGKHQYKKVSAKDPMVMICAVPKEYE